MIIYQCVPKAARRFIVKKMLAARNWGRVKEYYEPMRIYKPRTEPIADELPVIFDTEQRPIGEFDPYRLKGYDFCYGVFSSSRRQKRPQDFLFTFIRHPIDRFFSGYYHAHRHLIEGTEMMQDASRSVIYRKRYPEMVRLFQGSVENYVRTFLDAGGQIRFERNGLVYGPIEELFQFPPDLDQFDFIGVVERMAPSLAHLNQRLGLKLVDDGPINSGPTGPRPRWGEAELQRFFAREIEIFDFYKSRLDTSVID